jgi:hypothetical protein
MNPAPHIACLFLAVSVIGLTLVIRRQGCTIRNLQNAYSVLLEANAKLHASLRLTAKPGDEHEG